MLAFKPLPALVSVTLGLALWFVIPVPDGVNPEAWHLLAIFVATIAAIIGKTMRIGALAIIAITVVALTGAAPVVPPLPAVLLLLTLLLPRRKRRRRSPRRRMMTWDSACSTKI